MPPLGRLISAGGSATIVRQGDFVGLLWDSLKQQQIKRLHLVVSLRAGGCCRSALRNSRLRDRRALRRCGCRRAPTAHGCVNWPGPLLHCQDAPLGQALSVLTGVTRCCAARRQPHPGQKALAARTSCLSDFSNSSVHHSMEEKENKRSMLWLGAH